MISKNNDITPILNLTILPVILSKFLDKKLSRINCAMENVLPIKSYYNIITTFN